MQKKVSCIRKQTVGSVCVFFIYKINNWTNNLDDNIKDENEMVSKKTGATKS